MNFGNLQEEELKARIGDAFFSAFDCDTIIGKIDFCVTQKTFTRHNATKTETAPIVSLLWAEAKRGTVTDIYRPLVQLILTIGKARTFDTYLPPPFLAAFDAEKIAFLPYREILPFLAFNDFNWNVTSSDTSSREFGLLYDAVRDVLDRTAYLFRYDAHEKELREFIKQELKVSSKPLPLIKNHRERKGSFFTPKIWVDLSQKYLADVLGENWQDEYYVWDCAAGTGNLLNGLTNKYNIWASTLDQQDVDVMKDRIKNGANLLESHVFQFDFLNDEFTKLPQQLQEIINDPEKRKKLVIYINPPYVEATNAHTPTGRGENRSDIAREKRIYQAYVHELGKAAREIFVIFMARVYYEIPSSVLAIFSKLKILQGQNFVKFRNVFQAKLERLFLVPSNTFDNVKGKFPIGFYIWNCAETETFSSISADVYDAKEALIMQKQICVIGAGEVLLNWLQPFYNQSIEATGRLAYMVHGPSDFQHSNDVYCTLRPSQGVIDKARTHYISLGNLLPFCMFLTIRHCIAPTWLNQSDHFLYPKDDWQNDTVFQNDCFALALFHTQNQISCHDGINHWIPFTESEVNAKEKFESHFMTDFISGRLASETSHNSNNLLNEQSFVPSEPLIFSPEATAVFDAGRELWRYYHAQPGANPNASYYDIREHFQGRNEKGKMNPKSDDVEYMRLLANLKEAIEALRLKIVSKVYEYGFLIF